MNKEIFKMKVEEKEDIKKFLNLLVNNFYQLSLEEKEKLIKTYKKIPLKNVIQINNSTKYSFKQSIEIIIFICKFVDINFLLFNSYSFFLASSYIKNPKEGTLQIKLFNLFYKNSHIRVFLPIFIKKEDLGSETKLIEIKELIKEYKSMFSEFRVEKVFQKNIFIDGIEIENECLEPIYNFNKFLIYTIYQTSKVNLEVFSYFLRNEFKIGNLNEFMFNTLELILSKNYEKLDIQLLMVFNFNLETVNEDLRKSIYLEISRCILYLLNFKLSTIKDYEYFFKEEFILSYLCESAYLKNSYEEICIIFKSIKETQEKLFKIANTKNYKELSKKLKKCILEMTL